MMWVAAIMMAISIGTVVYAIIPQSTNKPMADKFLNQKLGGSESVLTKFAVRSADQAMKAKTRSDLAVKLSVAGLGFRPAEWVVIRMAPAFGLAAMGYLFSGWFLALLGVVVGSMASFLFLRMKVSSARNKFEEDLPGLLTLVAGSLKSGMSLPRALDVACEAGRDPMVSEIRRALAHSRVGVAIEDSFEDLADRMDSQDFAWVAMSIRIQKEVGGNLAEVLTATAETIRERAYIVRQVKSLSAEGRLSAYILIGLPFVVISALMFMNPGYLEPLWNEFMGWGILASGVIMLTLGWFWLKAVVRVEA